MNSSMSTDSGRRDGTPWIVFAIYIVSISIAVGVSNSSPSATFYVAISLFPAAIGFILLISSHISGQQDESSNDQE